jgi:hypothetical protein
MIKVHIRGAEKLKKWTLKLSKKFDKAQKKMHDLFDYLYQKRMDAGVDIHGRKFTPNKLFLAYSGALKTPITIANLKAHGEGPLVRTGKMKKSLIKQISGNKLKISFDTAAYSGGESPATVAAKHQSGFTVEAGKLIVIEGYSQQSGGATQSGFTRSKYFVKRNKSFQVPARKHFGIPASDVQLFTDIFADAVLQGLRKNHGGVI